MLLSKIKYIFGFCAVLCGISSVAGAAFLSDYGQIQGVPNYSLMPGGNIGGVYNPKFPQVVYAQGVDLDTAECEQTVATLIAAYCSGIQNCVDMRLSDVRPVIMVQLSRLPGHNYASACGGFIDSEFDRFVAQYGNAAPRYNTQFPAATKPVENQNDEFKIKNPYEIKLNDWQMDYLERANELERLQAINGAGSESVTKADFPETFADLSFEDRMAILQSGYEPYKDATAYKQMNIEDYKDYLTRVKETQNLAKKKERVDGGKSDAVAVEGKDDGITPADQSSVAADVVPAGNIEALLPWYGVLVVKKGSLDKYADNTELPIVSSEYLKLHKDAFYPANSAKPLGMWRGCTHGNHTAHDKDVVNRAAHITMGQDDSFWTGSDFYVYDGEDVYWGWAQLVGEVALALVTAGISAEVQAGAVAAQTSAATATAISGVGKSVKAVNVIKNSSKVKKAATTAKNVTAATKANAINELRAVGVEVKGTASVAQISKIGQILLDAKSNVTWVSALKHTKWKLVKEGVKNIGPTTARLMGPGSTWGTRFKTLAVGTATAGLGYELIKAFGYSTAAVSMKQYGEQYKDLKFSGFGLLSDDNIEGRENEVSHGAWIKFEENGTIGVNDARDEALAWAEEFQKDMTYINNSDPLCDVDIYVVQPAISKPLTNTDKREVFYVIQNPGASLRVSSGDK